MTVAVQHRQLGPYRLERRIAIGGMAEIYAAHRPDSAQGVVVKLLLPQLATDAELVTMFLDEGRLARSLHHPNLVRVFELGHHGGEAYLVMEHVEGVALARLIRRANVLPLELAVHITDCLLVALGYLHDHRDAHGQPLEIIHRDVTPGNVLLSTAGEVKLGDFGIAKHRMRSFKTRSGVVKGTLQYMAPEQLTGGDVDRRTDLYGVGLILFELVTGRPFLRGEREVDLMHVALDPPWTPPTSCRPGLPAAFDALLRPALRRFPEQRYANADSFRLALHELTRTLGLDLSAARTTLSAQVRQAAEEAQQATRSALQQVADASGCADPATDGDCATLPAFASGPSAGASAPAASERPASARPSQVPTSPLLPLSAAPPWRRWLMPAALLAALLALSLAGVFVLRPDARRWLLGEPQAPRPALATASPDLAPNAPATKGQALQTAASKPDAALPEGAPNAGTPDRGLQPRVAARALRPPASGQRRLRPARPQPASQPPLASTTVDERTPTSSAASAPEVWSSVSRQLTAALAALLQQGVTLGDLDAASQLLLRELRRALAQQDPSASTLWDQLQPRLTAVQITPALVEAKLKRVDKLLRQAKSQGRSVAALESQTTMALQELMDGRHQAANRQLNRILAALGH